MTVLQNDVLRVTAEMTVNSHDLQNVYHFRSTNVGGVSDAKALDDMAETMEDMYQKIDTLLTDTLTFDAVRVQNVTQGTLLGSADWPLLVAGTLATSLLPEAAAALITYGTVFSRVRGGTYYGGFTETENATGGTLTAATVTQLVALAAELLGEYVYGADSYRYIVYNTILKTFAVPVSAAIQTRWRTQRRRRTGVGS